MSNGDAGAEDKDPGKNEIIHEAEEGSINKGTDRSEMFKATEAR